MLILNAVYNHHNLLRVNLADSVHLLDNLSITIYSIPADKYHVPHIVFF